VSSSTEDVAHLLRRSGFVAPAARVAALSSLDWPAVVEAVLDTSAAPAEDYPSWLLSYDQENGWRQHVLHLQWWLDRCVSTPTPIVEKMLHFWHGHFVVSWSKVYHMPAMVSLSRKYRAGGLGNLATLAQQMAVEPAMLWYLDNSDNVKASPNQNFARELMELFLLGVGNYTEDDVIASARAWTGHSTVDWNVATYLFRSGQHDNANKTFFGTTRNWDGPEIITEILTNPTKRPIVAKYLAKKLWEFFAYQNPAQGIVDQLATDFVNSGLEIKALLRSIFNRPEFRSTTAKQGLVRSPIEWVVAAMAATGVPAAEAHPEWVLDTMGQEPFNPPNVSGWRQNGYWVNTSAFNGRALFARNAGWYLKERGFWNGIESWTPGLAISTAESTFGVTFSDTTRAALLRWFDRQRTADLWAEHENFITLVLLAPELHLA